MASISGNSSTSLCNPALNSGSEDNLNQAVTDQRKRKRMQSNRESARRSRMRKQQHLDGLMNQVNQLKEENSQILTGISITRQKYLNVEAESSIFRAQMAELSQRLQSLNEIITFISITTPSSQFVIDRFGFEGPEINYDGPFDARSWFANSLNNRSNGNNGLSYYNQPMVASADIFLY